MCPDNLNSPSTFEQLPMPLVGTACLFLILQHAESLGECHPVVGGPNYLYMLMFHSVADNPPRANGELQSYGIITSKHLAFDNDNVVLYHGNEKLSVTMHRLEELIKLDLEEMELIKNFHYTLFGRILCLKGAHLEADLKSSLKGYVVIPIIALTQFNPIQGFIDKDLMHKIVQNKIVKWHCSLDQYTNSLVRVNHRSDIDPVTQSHRLYCVTKVHNDKSPSSPFPDGQGKTFKDYYQDKYNYSFSDPNQPLLEVMYASTRLDHLTQRHGQSSGEEDTIRKTQELFPEICEIHPLSVEMYKLARLLPSFFYRLESMLSAHELITEVNLSFYGSDTFTSPSSSLVVRALTLQGAQDCFNMERLELLGDTFLKMITTVFLYSTLPGTAPVSILTNRRSEMFSNIRLYLLAKKKYIPSKMKASIFKARSMWLPPGYKFTDSRGIEYEQFTSQTIPDKRVADCTEALIGAYIVTGGIIAGLRFLEWLGFFKMQLSATMINTNSSLSGKPLDILLTSDMLERYFGPPHTERRSPSTEVERKLFAGLQKIDSLWKFHDKYILLEAMTHVSYTYNRVTGSYQRLELLGDAILDYLITTYIYCEYPDYDEGKVSLLRSALVSNTTLALFAVVHNFHKVLKHNSPKLFSKIQQFTETSADIVRQLKDLYQDVVYYDNDMVF